jgi:hypothetical protein
MKFISSIPRTLRSVAFCLGGSVLLTSCSGDLSTEAGDATSGSPLSSSSSRKVALCHGSESHHKILEIGEPALAAHLSHGDYVTTLRVSDGQPDNVVHFRRIEDALAAAKAGRLSRGELVSAACRITILVSAGVHRGTSTGAVSSDLEHFPLIVDVPDITLRGALVMALDGSGRATGIGTDGEDRDEHLRRPREDGEDRDEHLRRPRGRHHSETTLTPTEPLPIEDASTPIILVNVHPGGSAGNNLVVEGFVFQSGHDPAVDAGGQGVFSMRATGLVIRGNRFEGGFSETVDVRETSADLVQNHLSGAGLSCDVCLAGPGTYRATGNHLGVGGIPGITVSAMVNLPLPSGVESSPLPATAETWAEIRNNEVRDHLRVPTGVGLRVEVVGVGAPNVHNIIHAVLQDNLLVNNRFGIIVHAGFPVPNTNLHADVDVTLGGNVIHKSCQTDLLVSLSRHVQALGVGTSPYLLNSTFRLELGGDVDWNDAWFSHPAGFGNTLVVDGQVIENGNRQFYDATGCPGL